MPLTLEADSARALPNIITTCFAATTSGTFSARNDFSTIKLTDPVKLSVIVYVNCQLPIKLTKPIE